MRTPPTDGMSTPSTRSASPPSRRSAARQGCPREGGCRATASTRAVAVRALPWRVQGRERSPTGANGPRAALWHPGAASRHSAEQRIELALYIGQCLDRPRGMARQQAQDQSIGRRQALSMAETDSPSEVIEYSGRQHALDLVGELSNSAASHSSLLPSCEFGDSMIGDFVWDFNDSSNLLKINEL